MLRCTARSALCGKGATATCLCVGGVRLPVSSGPESLTTYNYDVHHGFRHHLHLPTHMACLALWPNVEPLEHSARTPREGVLTRASILP
jgi:hypothetical protein